MPMRRSLPKLSAATRVKLDAVDYGRMSGEDLMKAYDGGNRTPRDTHAIAKKAAATRKARGGGLSGNLAKASAHAKR